MELYDEIYDKFVDLVNKKIDEVVLTFDDMKKLDNPHYWTDTDGQIVYGVYRNNTYADALTNEFKGKLERTVNPANNTYIFRKLKM